METIDYTGAAYLLRRMGFGGPPEEIEALVAKGRDGAVDYLLNYESINNSSLDRVLSESFDFTNPSDVQKLNRNELRRWWFTRMIHTNRQFEEKMTLFWHNHFATAFSKVQDTLMFLQNVMLRSNTLARFDELLLKVAQDPAMLVWLDGITNVLGSPNENFARELQELFTMGINDVVTGEPNYTEEDVKEIARAFTGWKFRRDRTSELGVQFLVNPAEHDNTAKTIYGQTANFSGEDVITVIAARRATARFLVHELFDFFVYPLSDSVSDRTTIEKFADTYVSSNHSIKELMRAIFTSTEFFSERARGALVKTPAEFIVGAIRMIGGQYEPGSSGARRENNLQAFSQGMGMDIFNPPDVAGWDLNLGWINTANMLSRFNFANTLATTRPNRPDAVGFWITTDQLRKNVKASAKKTVKSFLSVLGPVTVDSEIIGALKSYLVTNEQGEKVGFTNDDQTIDIKVRGLVHLIMCLSEFQLS